MVLAHSFIGAPLTYLLIKNKKLSPRSKNLAYFVGVTGAILPDLDLLLSFFIKDLNHRKLISHSIVPYLIIFLSLILASFFLKRHRFEVRILNLVAFVTIFSHLLIDYFVGTIALFGPFDPRLYGYNVPFAVGKGFFLKYFNSQYLIYELIVISIFFIFFKKYKQVPAIYLSFFYFLVAIAMVFRFSLI
jgi:membrane-bound metal-dependent hydrolase YbcI (DUF457 family)